MKAGLVGSAIEGRVLASTLLNEDIDVMIGTREPLAMLWYIPGLLNNQWTHAFKLLKQ